MKVGIVTQPLWGNYGGILQNFALQQVLKNMGHDPITFDFQWGYSGFHYFIHEIKNVVNVLLNRSKKIFLPYAPTRVNKTTNDFICRYILKTPPFWNIYSSSLIKKNNCDAIIVGSDQVWRPCYNPRLKDMFLYFCKTKHLKKSLMQPHSELLNGNILINWPKNVLN